MIQGSTVFDLNGPTDIQNQINLKRNEQALKTSKDITVTNTMTKKQIFDKINAEAENDCMSENEDFQRDNDANNIVIREEKDPGERSRNLDQDNFLNVKTPTISNLKTTVSTAGGLSSHRADNTISSYRTQIQSRYKITKILEDVMESAIEPK